MAAILKDSNPIQITNQSHEMVAPMRAERKDVNRFWNPKNEGGIGFNEGYVSIVCSRSTEM